MAPVRWPPPSRQPGRTSGAGSAESRGNLPEASRVVSNRFRDRRECGARVVERAARRSRGWVFQALVFGEPPQEAEVGKVYGPGRFPEHLQIAVVTARSLCHVLSHLATHHTFDRPTTDASI
jgi:hypothetical protein